MSTSYPRIKRRREYEGATFSQVETKICAVTLADCKPKQLRDVPSLYEERRA